MTLKVITRQNVSYMQLCGYLLVKTYMYAKTS